MTLLETQVCGRAVGNALQRGVSRYHQAAKRTAVRENSSSWVILKVSHLRESLASIFGDPEFYMSVVYGSALHWHSARIWKLWKPSVSESQDRVNTVVLTLREQGLLKGACDSRHFHLILGACQPLNEPQN